MRHLVNYGTFAISEQIAYALYGSSLSSAVTRVSCVMCVAELCLNLCGLVVSYCMVYGRYLYGSSRSSAVVRVACVMCVATCETIPVVSGVLYVVWYHIVLYDLGKYLAWR